jgi:chromosome segregation ATPase
VDNRCPSCEERGSGRVLGDATRGRIDDLEPGWSLPGPAKPIPIVQSHDPTIEATTFDPRTPPPEPLATSEPLAVRRGGLWGDVRYAAAVVLGVARGRKELGDMKVRLARERDERGRRLVEIARAAESDDEVPNIDDARLALRNIADDRAARRRAIALASAATAKADQDRGATSRGAADKLRTLDVELARIDAQLAPIEKQAADAKKDLDALRARLADVDKRLAALDRRAAAARDPAERATIDADLAVARAERGTYVRDEPAKQQAIAALQPQIAELTNARDAARNQAVAVRAQAEADDQRLALGGRAARDRMVAEERALLELDATEAATLAALGETLDRARPRQLAIRFRAVDEHAASIGAIERRILEIEDATAAIDRGALYRGLALMAGTIVLTGVLIGIVIALIRS